jgi:hypothetical protein
MDTHDFQSFMQLFDRIEADLSLKDAGRQLACIAKLVFYCGVREAEIPELTIRDVIDQNGKIIRVIPKFKKPIVLTDEIERCIAKHIDEMNNRNPSLVKRKSPLFPAYPNTRKIKRNLKTFGTTHTQIHHAGIHYYYQKGLAAGRSKGWIYENGSRQKRISVRQFQAVALKAKIPAGVSVDNRCVDEIIRIFDAAERLDKNDPDGKKKATYLIKKYKKVLECFRSNNLKKIYEDELSRLESMLS